jgi:hypothetical protein
MSELTVVREREREMRKVEGGLLNGQINANIHPDTQNMVHVLCTLCTVDEKQLHSSNRTYKFSSSNLFP